MATRLSCSIVWSHLAGVFFLSPLITSSSEARTTSHHLPLPAPGAPSTQPTRSRRQEPRALAAPRTHALRCLPLRICKVEIVTPTSVGLGEDHMATTHKVLGEGLTPGTRAIPAHRGLELWEHTPHSFARDSSRPLDTPHLAWPAEGRGWRAARLSRVFPFPVGEGASMQTRRRSLPRRPEQGLQGAGL